MDARTVLYEKTRLLGADATAKAVGVGALVLSKMVCGTFPVSAEVLERIRTVWGHCEPVEPITRIIGTDRNGEDAFKGKDVCILMPTYKFVNPKTHLCLMALALTEPVGTFSYRQITNQSMIARARNWLATCFLRETTCEWSLWIDDDMIVPCGSAPIFSSLMKDNLHKIPEKFRGFKIHTRLKSWGKTVVGGVYFSRGGDSKQPTVGFQQFNGIPFELPHDALHPIRYCGTGALLVHRSVYTDIAAKYPELAPSEDPKNYESGFFTPMQKDGRMYGEDEAFQVRATEAGHPAHLDLGCICGHIGEKTYGIPDGK